MNSEQWLNDIEAKADAATPGEWFPDGYDVQTKNNDACVCCCNAPTVDIEDENEQEANTTFIAAANPATVKRLVAMVRASAFNAARSKGLFDDLAYWIDTAYQQTESHS